MAKFSFDKCIRLALMLDLKSSHNILLGKFWKISSTPSLLMLLNIALKCSFNECNKLALVLDLKIKPSHNMYIAMLSRY